MCGANFLTHDSDLPPFNCQMLSTEQIGIAKSHTKARGKRETNSLLTQFQHVAIHQDNFTDRSPDYEGRLEWKCLTLFNEIFAATQMGVRSVLCCLVDDERERKANEVSCAQETQILSLIGSGWLSSFRENRAGRLRVTTVGNYWTIVFVHNRALS